MPPEARAEALRRMSGEPENSGMAQHQNTMPSRRWRSGKLQSPQQAAMDRMQPQAPEGQAPPPPPPPGPPQPQAQFAHMFHSLRARLIARGMSPADAARAAALSLRRRSGAAHF